MPNNNVQFAAVKMGQLSSQVRGKHRCGFQSIATNVTTSKSSLPRLGFQTLVINKLPVADHLQCHLLTVLLLGGRI